MTAAVAPRAEKPTTSEFDPSIERVYVGTRGDGSEQKVAVPFEPLEALRDAVAAIQSRHPASGISLRWTLNRGMQLLVGELMAYYNGGAPFPPRDCDLRPGRRPAAKEGERRLAPPSREAQLAWAWAEAIREEDEARTEAAPATTATPPVALAPVDEPDDEG